MRSSIRFLAFVPALIALGSVVLDLVLIEFFGAFFFPVLGLLAYVGVGLLLTLRLPRHPVGWLLLWAGALFQLALAAVAYGSAAFTREPGTLPFAEVALLIGFAWIPALGCLFVAIMLFPTGRPPSRRWRLPVAFVVMGNAILLLAAWLGLREFPQPLGVQGASPVTLANPLWIDGPVGMLLSYVYWSPFSYVVYLIPVAAVLVRFRTAAGNERHQLKWFAYTSSIAMVFFAAAGVVPALFSYLSGLGPTAAIMAMDLIPISVAIAILRYRLYDIDLLIKRTLVYGATSVTIAATFFLGLVSLQAALRPLTSGSELAVAASTLVSFALFQPIRRRVQDGVNRRFDRSRYNAARTIDAFADQLRDDVDLDTLGDELLGAVNRTMAPAHASLWLRERTR
jgi:hypothetical protein